MDESTMALRASGQWLCEKCRSLFQHKFLEDRVVKHERHKHEWRECEETWEWQPDFQSVRASANDGCRLCTDLLHDWSTLDHIKLEDPAISTDLGRIECTMTVSFAKRWVYIFFNALQPSKEPPYNRCWLGKPREISARPITSLNTPPIVTHIDTLSSTQECLKRAKQWLHQCSTHHHTCSRRAAGRRELPTRLVEVRKEGIATKARLVKDFERHETIRYITLSYRWGNKPNLQLRKDTLPGLMNDIPLDKTRELFRDVFDVVLQLGCTYVWIDALCIIQDSQQDWEREAARMAQVYQFAYCNIAAAATTDLTPSLFGVRTSDRPTLLTVNFDFQLGNDRFTGSHHLNDTQFWSTRVYSAALSKRGWVLQERFFSPRILHFSYDQILWECQELEASETFPDSIPGHSPGAFKHSNEIAELNVKDSYGTIIEAWEAVRSLYSGSALTYLTDKLFAISGIVKWFEVILKDENVAGLWRKTLITDLLWHRDPYAIEAPRVHDGRAPSWSWACLDAPTRQSRIDKSDSSFQVLASILSIDIKHCDKTLTGLLTIRAPVAKVICRIENGRRKVHLRPKDPFPTFYLDIDDNPRDVEGLEVDIEDGIMESLDDKQAVWVYLLGLVNDGYDKVQGLVLRRTNKPGCYSRIGHFPLEGALGSPYMKYILEASVELGDQDYHERHGEGVFSVTII